MEQAVAALDRGWRRLGALHLSCQVPQRQLRECLPFHFKSQVDWLDLSFLGATHGEEKDRHFLVYDGQSLHFHTARTVPLVSDVFPRVSSSMVTVSCSVKDGSIRLEAQGRNVVVDLQRVEDEGQVVITT